MSKVLNLYAGIGGNRKLWENVEVTAVEMNPEIAAIYQDFFPDDTVIVGDAHQYLLDHFKEFDFIWSSPPCPSHSRANYWANAAENRTIAYPDMTLYQELLLLKHYFKGEWVVENVIPYYTPLIEGVEIGRHLFWSNFYIPNNGDTFSYKGNDRCSDLQPMLGFDLTGYRLKNKLQVLRNCVSPKTGLHILNTAIGAIPPIQEGLFSPHKEDER